MTWPFTHRRCVARQERHHRRHVRGLGDPPHGLLLHPPQERLVLPGQEQLGAHGARRHHVGGDPLRRHLLGQDPRHGLHGSVGRRVRRVARQERAQGG